jgi:hypothetical protein
VQSQPQPYFVKIGPRKKIFYEWTNYVAVVHPSLPFHLAPRLALDRCALGSVHGILVGDFVEDSESLTECSSSARASTPVGTLFDKTLRGWRFAAKAELQPELEGFLIWQLDGHIPKERQKLAAKLGAKRDAESLRSALETALHARLAQNFLWGQVHGDMHTNNVRVRGNDAILIDFQNSYRGPLLSDPAMLEVSLSIRAPKNFGFDEISWMRTMQMLYHVDCLRAPPDMPAPTDKYAWLAACIRQTRLHALAMQLSAGQYCLLLAFRFFQAATKDHVAKAEENFRRAGALLLAEQLLEMKWV